MKTIAIIGGGAAGLTAAVSAARSGAEKVILIEKNERVGKKILATGNGRCNLTNMHMSEKNYHGEDSEFVKYSLQVFSPEDCIRFYNSIGLMTRIEEEGRVYPYSGQASAVLDTLRMEISKLNIEVIDCFNAVNISCRKKRFRISPPDGDVNNEAVYANKVIITTGGYNYGRFCSLLEETGHAIIKPYPALTQLKTELPMGGLKGTRFTGVITLKNKNDIIAKEQGELMFTDYGISGIPTMQISGYVRNSKNLTVSIDFTPDISYDTLLELLRNRIRMFERQNVADFLTGMLNKKIGYAVIKLSGLENFNMPVNSVSECQLLKIADTIKNTELKVKDTNGFGTAQVTGGGADTRMFDPVTMESKVMNGLYAAGEVLDIYGDCGGYNLHWAWASGYIAGENAQKKL